MKIKSSYDRETDVLHLTAEYAETGEEQQAEEVEARAYEDEPGIVVRYNPSTGKTVGITVLDYRQYWYGRLGQLMDVLKEALDLTRDEIFNIIRYT